MSWCSSPRGTRSPPMRGFSMRRGCTPGTWGRGTMSRRLPARRTPVLMRCSGVKSGIGGIRFRRGRCCSTAPRCLLSPPLLTRRMAPRGMRPRPAPARTLPVPSQRMGRIPLRMRVFCGCRRCIGCTVRRTPMLMSPPSSRRLTVIPPAAVRAGHRHSQRVKPPMPSSCSPVRS